MGPLASDGNYVSANQTGVKFYVGTPEQITYMIEEFNRMERFRKYGAHPIHLHNGRKRTARKRGK